VRSTRVIDKQQIDFQELHDACLMCTMAYKSPSVIKDLYGIQAIVGEDSTKGIRFFIVPPAKGQLIIILGGCPSESLVGQMMMEVHFGLDSVVSQIEQAQFFKTIPKKETMIHIYGHSFGAACAMYLSHRLLNLGFKIEKMLTFGQPKTIRETESPAFRNLPLLRVIDFHDPHFINFPGHSHIGPVVVLFEEISYQYSAKHADDREVEQSPDNNHVEYYLRNLKYKLKGALPIDDRKTRRTLVVN